MLNVVKIARRLIANNPSMPSIKLAKLIIETPINIKSSEIKLNEIKPWDS